MEYLISIDRESFQKEIETLKQKNKTSLEQIQELKQARKFRNQFIKYYDVL